MNGLIKRCTRCHFLHVNTFHYKWLILTMLSPVIQHGAQTFKAQWGDNYQGPCAFMCEHK